MIWIMDFFAGVFALLCARSTAICNGYADHWCGSGLATEKTALQQVMRADAIAIMAGRKRHHGSQNTACFEDVLKAPCCRQSDASEISPE